MTMRRRQFLHASATAGGGLLLAFSWGCRDHTTSASASKQAPPEPEPAATHELNAYLRIDTDGSVTCIVPEAEMGQGILTAIAMILAEELDADWASVRAELAPADARKYGRQSTGGSTSIRGGLDGLRLAGASARHMLIEAAAATWGVDAAECSTEPGQVVHKTSGKRAGFGALAGKAATLEPPGEPPIKQRSDYRIVGTRVPRLDIASKVDGSAVFGLDVRRPGMLVAQVERPPTIGGSVRSLDATATHAVPGVRDVLQIPSGVAVVADHFWAAKKGRDALAVDWEPGPNAALSTQSIDAKLAALAGRGVEARSDGNAVKALSTARSDRLLRAVYRAPYLAHAPMEPLNCTAEVLADRVELWVSTQSPTQCQRVAAEISGLPADKVAVHSQLCGGGFGRRSQVDFVADAVHLAKATGKPVQVVYTREDDVRGGFYRPAAYNELAGAVDAEGWPVAWEHRIASPSILEAFGPLDGGIDRAAIEGAANLPYVIPNLRVTYAKPDLPVTTWFWRSVGSSQNAWVTECFLDELARLGKKDPVEVRRRLLVGSPRHRRVLDVAVERAGRGRPLPDGIARGVAVHESFGSVVAQVAEVSLERGSPRVHRVVCAIDCGEVINPDTIEAQVESSIAYGLSAALYGRIDVKAGRVVQSNFHDYKAIRIHEMPRVDVHIAAAGDPVGGVGEPALPPIAPAVANALLALTGTPVRALPMVS